MSSGGGQFKYLFLGSSYPGFTIDFYSAGTLTGKNVWVDENKSSAVQQISADAHGMAVWYADGDYRMRVKDADGTLLWDWPSIKITSDSMTMWEGNFGLSYPTATSTNIWQMFSKVDASNNFLELGINDGDSWRTLVQKESDDSAHVFSKIISDDIVLKAPVVDARYFDVVGDGVTDDTTNLQTFINYCATNSINGYIKGHCLFTKLYFYRDATLNPGFPSSGYRHGRFRIFGDGCMDKDNLVNGDRFRTVLESTDGAGPAIMLDGTTVGQVLSDMTIIADNTTYVIQSIDDMKGRSGLFDLTIEQQNNSGGGILIEDVWTCSFKRILCLSTATTPTGTGFTIRNAGNNAGMNYIESLTCQDWAIGAAIGHTDNTLKSLLQGTTLVNCQMKDNAFAMDICGGAMNTVIINPYLEGYTSSGIRLYNYPQHTTMIGGHLNGPNATVADIKIGDSTLAGTARCAKGVKITGTRLTNIKAYGIKRDYVDEYCKNLIIENVLLDPAVAGIGVGIGLTADTNQYSLRIINPEFGNLATEIENSDDINFYCNDVHNSFGTAVNQGQTPNVASAATITLNRRGNFTAITGTTNIHTITPYAGAKPGLEITLKFNGALTVEDGSGNLKLAGSFTVTADDTLKLAWDGDYWYELSRSVN